jgi:hypothetical protein
VTFTLIQFLFADYAVLTKSSFSTPHCDGSGVRPSQCFGFCAFHAAQKTVPVLQKPEPLCLGISSSLRYATVETLQRSFTNSNFTISLEETSDQEARSPRTTFTPRSSFTFSQPLQRRGIRLKRTCLPADSVLGSNTALNTADQTSVEHGAGLFERVWQSIQELNESRKVCTDSACDGNHCEDLHRRFKPSRSPTPRHATLRRRLLKLLPQFQGTRTRDTVDASFPTTLPVWCRVK